MGQARVTVWAAPVLAVLAMGAPAGRAAPARFMFYASEAQCVAGRTLPAALCRTAFARARAEFEARTTAFPTLAACTGMYGSCAPWGSGKGAGFRPLFQGVDIVDTPGEQSVTPASPVRALRFAALPLAGPVAPPRELTVRGPRKAAARPAPGRAAAQGPGPAPVPGAGFTLENGVLTYPAPARFAPRNLPKPE